MWPHHDRTRPVWELLLHVRNKFHPYPWGVRNGDEPTYLLRQTGGEVITQQLFSAIKIRSTGRIFLNGEVWNARRDL